jgi:hypothetical protein
MAEGKTVLIEIWDSTTHFYGLAIQELLHVWPYSLLPVNMCSQVALDVVPLHAQYLCCILQGFACSAFPAQEHVAFICT